MPALIPGRAYIFWRTAQEEQGRYAIIHTDFHLHLVFHQARNYKITG